MKVSVTGSVRAFNLTPEKEALLSALCRKQGLKFRMVAEVEFSQPLNVLFGFVPKSNDASDACAFSEELLLLYNVKGSSLDKFLRALRQQNLSFPYKAVLTPSNATWTPTQLLSELKKEHAAMEQSAEER